VQKTQTALTEVVRAAEQALRDAGLAGARIVVGLSGGVDSVVLLHVLVGLAERSGAMPSAVHVHHGLSPHADRWADFCAGLCRNLGVELREVRVAVPRRSKLGVEGAAREARYAVFRQQPADAVALGHHADDQAETLLLQLFRGAGARGLSAMPACRVLEPATGLRLVRPLLSVGRAELLAYAAKAGLSWVEDESNCDLTFDRNFLRAGILPQLGQRFPGLRQTLGRTALNLGEAVRLLDELAAGDAGPVQQGLAVSALAALSPERARNALRWYLEQHGVPPPGRARLEEALRQALMARGDSRLQVSLGPARLRRHRGRLQLEATVRTVPADWSVTWSGEPQLDLPEGLGTVRFEPALGTGLSLAGLREHAVALRGRSGGERLRLTPGRPSRTLKNLLQEAGTPEWERDRLPLLFAGDALVWVPGIGMDQRFAAQPGAEGVLPQWVRS
jgi:tRNA(Ile)-lysidine synthase